MNQPENMTLKGTLEQRRSSKLDNSLSATFAKPGRWSVLLAVLLAPWAFGSVHFWAQQILATILLVGLGFWWFETAMNNRHKQTVPYIALIVIAGLLLGLVQVIALPGFVGEMVLGHQTEIYKNFSGDESLAARISLNPEETWGQVRLLTMALAGLLLGCRYFRTMGELNLLLGVCAANGVLLSFLGIIQKLTYDGKIFWTFQVLAGSPFGPFVNKNNAAGYLIMTMACCLGLIPIVMTHRKTTGPIPIISKEMPFWRQFYFYAMYWVSELTATKIAVLLSTVLIAAGVIGCGSRGGGLAMLAGGVITLVFYGIARRPKNTSMLLVPLVFLIAALTGWVGLSDQLIERFEKTDLSDVTQMDGRVQNWRDTYPAISEMGWLGSGLGSYRQVHRLYNSEREDVLFEYAENQYFQSAVEAGWPGFFLFVAAWLLAFRYANLLLFQGQSPSTIGVGTFGVFLLSSQAVASFFDFGLYIPANMLLMSVLVGLLAGHAHSLAGRLKKRSWLRFECPNYLVQTLLLVLFAGLTMASLGLYRRARLESAMATRPEEFDYKSLDIAATEKKIKSLEPLISKCHAVDGLNYLAELWIHRGRLMYLAEIRADDEFKNSLLLFDEKEKQNLIDRLWAFTTLQRIQENAEYLKRNVSRFQAIRFINEPCIRENLPFAARYFTYSRQRAPLQPVVQLRMGQLIAAMGGDSKDRLEANLDIERGIELAPSNPDYRLIASLYYMPNGQHQSAAPHVHKYLELVPGAFTPIMQLLAGQTDHRLERVSERTIFESMIPDNPVLLFDFARNWSAGDPKAKELALDKADQLLGESTPTRVNEILLRADIRLEKGDTDLAIEAMKAALKGNPMDLDTQLRVANLLFEQNKYQEALEEAQKLLRFNRRNPSYNALIKSIEDAIENQEN